MSKPNGFVVPHIKKSRDSQLLALVHHLSGVIKTPGSFSLSVFHLRTPPLLVAIWLPQPKLYNIQRPEMAEGGCMGLAWEQPGRKTFSLYTSGFADFPVYITRKNGITCSPEQKPELCFLISKPLFLISEQSVGSVG